ncbi:MULTISPECIES: pentapeptide repeat-containing protein [unclassified Nodularia (in: cyanobacteria)]|uniref:pentapeptide repeat-containing protein n=1 Tax=unclassified Nodularia (in: cyanobacteria) TaxID=2656917 RepID=UPI00187E943F|nr:MULTISPECIES: pentapeptide repeat-containing protein [unclassified Nodularia (in: cyanobacteria)]MBE9201230.1 pentapeptide repeat-containing protein [Nodularia sp. LEGE 06071]MCC2695823.1 pentapeptide repeat-containing protein [Nodularia sp. LEGE 04288]
MGRSHRVSAAGIEKVNKAFDRYGTTQECLGGLAGCTRQTVIKFFAGRPVEKRLFKTLCDTLELEWADIAELESEEVVTSKAVIMNKLRSVESETEVNSSTATVLQEELCSPQIIVTSNARTGKFVIKIPGDLNKFLQNTEEQKTLLEAVKKLAGDENAKIDKIERGSIKITFNVSPSGIKRLEELIKSGKLEDNLKEEQNKIYLVQRITHRAKGTELDLSDTNLSGTDLRGIDLSGIDLSCADLSNANLENANLENADLNCADVSGANLSGANLNNADFSDAIVKNAANLSGANLSGANLDRTDLSGANLSGANLSGATVKNAQFGDNPGITEDKKRELKQRGAIFEDSHGDRAEVFAR